MTSPTPMASPTRLDPDRLAELEEQRDHLLASIEDLEREHAAGDLDDHDYDELKDDYTARAAEVLRAIDEHRELVARSRPPRNWKRTAVVAVSVLALAVVAGVLVARSSGQRGTGTLTGNDDNLRQQLASCQTLSFREPAEGIDCYAAILEEHPDNVDALTYQGWAYIRDDQVERGAQNLARAVEIDPDHPDARVFRAVLLSRAGAAAAAAGDSDTARESYLAAAAEVDRFFRNDPSEVAVQVLQQEGLERSIYFGLIDRAVYECWQKAAAAGGDQSAASAEFVSTLGTCLDGVLAADPGSVDAQLSKALSLVGTEQPDTLGARALTDRILSIDPQNANALLLQASLALMDGDLDAATALLDRLEPMPRPTASFLIGDTVTMRRAVEQERTAGSTATTTAPRSSVSTVPGAPTIPNAGGG